MGCTKYDIFLGSYPYIRSFQLQLSSPLVPSLRLHPELSYYGMPLLQKFRLFVPFGSQYEPRVAERGSSGSPHHRSMVHYMQGPDLSPGSGKSVYRSREIGMVMQINPNTGFVADSICLIATFLWTQG